MAPAPLKIKTPHGTTAITISALSLYDKKSEVDVSWTEGQASFGGSFVGPKPGHALTLELFDLPYINIVKALPKELSLSFNFFSGMHQPTIEAPVTTKVGPEGTSTVVQVQAYLSDKKAPTVVTILFQGNLVEFARNN